jgi:hypothetical protein
MISQFKKILKMRFRQRSKLLWLCSVLLLLSACFNKPNKKNIWEYQQLEARSKDIPVSLYFDPIIARAQQLESGSIQLFETKETIEFITNFYMDEMEREGWQNLFVVKGDQDALLSFEKPSRYCSISISSITPSKNCITIYATFKDQKI